MFVIVTAILLNLIGFVIVKETVGLAPLLVVLLIVTGLFALFLAIISAFKNRVSGG